MPYASRNTVPSDRPEFPPEYLLINVIINPTQSTCFAVLHAARQKKNPKNSRPRMGVAVYVTTFAYGHILAITARHRRALRRGQTGRRDPRGRSEAR
jgi:hypothetical protein